MRAKDYIGKTVEAIIDHPIGSKDPALGTIYPLNMGSAVEDPELQVYILGIFEPKKEFSGDCIAVIKRLDEKGELLVLVEKNKSYSDQQIRALTEFQERFHRSDLLR